MMSFWIATTQCSFLHGVQMSICSIACSLAPCLWKRYSPQLLGVCLTDDNPSLKVMQKLLTTCLCFQLLVTSSNLSLDRSHAVEGNLQDNQTFKTTTVLSLKSLLSRTCHSFPSLSITQCQGRLANSHHFEGRRWQSLCVLTSSLILWVQSMSSTVSKTWCYTIHHVEGTKRWILHICSGWCSFPSV